MSHDSRSATDPTSALVALQDARDVATRLIEDGHDSAHKIVAALRLADKAIIGLERERDSLRLSAGAATRDTYQPTLAEALEGTASLLADYAKLAKEPPSRGYTGPRTIEIAVWDHCPDGGEAVESFILDEGEAEAIAALIRGALSQSPLTDTSNIAPQGARVREGWCGWAEVKSPDTVSHCRRSSRVQHLLA